MQLTVELPEALVRHAEGAAAVAGVSFERWIEKAVESRLETAASKRPSAEAATVSGRPWKAAIEALPRVPQETLEAVSAAVAESDRLNLESQRSGMK